MVTNDHHTPSKQLFVKRTIEVPVIGLVLLKLKQRKSDLK